MGLIDHADDLDEVIIEVNSDRSDQHLNIKFKRSSFAYCHHFQPVTLNSTFLLHTLLVKFYIRIYKS